MPAWFPHAEPDKQHAREKILVTLDRHAISS
jgi:hypothetical protein